MQNRVLPGENSPAFKKEVGLSHSFWSRFELRFDLQQVKQGSTILNPIRAPSSEIGLSANLGVSLGKNMR